MASASRPEASLSIEAVITEWLPQQYATARRAAPADAPVVRASLSGEGGGAWDLRADPERLVVAVADHEAPGVWLRQSAADFRAALFGDADLPELLPPGWSVLDLLFMDPRDVELLRQVDGRIAVEVMGRRSRRFTFDVAFGKKGVQAGRPRAVVAVPGPVYEGLVRGSIPPTKPFFDGSLRIEGDRGLAMQLLMLFGARLSRR